MITDELFYGTKLFHKKLDEIFYPLKQYLGITQGDYIKVNAEGSLINIHTDYKWMERYLEKEFHINDPSFVHPKNASSGFAFLPAVDNESYKNSLLKEAIDNFDFHHSFIYVEKSNNSYTILGFGTDKENFSMPNKVLNSMGFLKKIIRKIINQIAIETKVLQENKVDLLKFKKDLFYHQPCLLSDAEQEYKKKIEILKNTGMLDKKFKDLDLVKLSNQETRSLEVYTEYYNIKKVAKELNITLNTAISYIENVKAKLNCNNKAALLQKAAILRELGKI